MSQMGRNIKLDVNLKKKKELHLQGLRRFKEVPNQAMIGIPEPVPISVMK